MKHLLIILISLNTLCGYSQKYTSKSKKAVAGFEDAQRSYSSDRLNEALKYLEIALKKDDCFIEAYLLKADILFTQKRYQEEIIALEKAISIDSAYFVPALFNMGVAMFNSGNYEEVAQWMEKYKQNNKTKRSSLNPDFWIQKATFAQEATSNPVYINPINLGDSINSSYDEYWPSISADGETMVFTVLVPKNPLADNISELPKNSVNFKEDFYISNNKKGTWEKCSPVVSINTNNNEGAQTLSADGKWMFFTACGRKGGEGSCDIYFSKRTIDGWTHPVNLGSPVNTPFWESQPCFSSDGKTLYFVSSRPGGEGKKDIWKAEITGYKNDGSPFFGKVENSGDKINTEGNENSPFIHHDNQTLYFSSDGWPGMGAMDLFYSKRNSSGKWEKPVNLGYPLNTEKDEIGLVINAKGDTGYFSSDGFKDSKDKDIYRFNIPENIRPVPVSYVKGKVFDKDTREVLSADIRVNEIPGGELSVNTKTADYSGGFLFCLPTGKVYALNIQKEGYLFYSDHFNVLSDMSIEKPQTLNVYLSKIRTGERFVLKNVFFETDSYILKHESHIELDYVIELLSLNPDVRVEVGGHTDNVGTPEYNMDLANKRAQAVYKYLINNGISESRLKYKGYGFDMPIDSNVTEDGRSRNRRTECKIL